MTVMTEQAGSQKRWPYHVVSFTVLVLCFISTWYCYYLMYSSQTASSLAPLKALEFLLSKSETGKVADLGQQIPQSTTISSLIRQANRLLKPKIILLWTPWFDDTLWKEIFGLFNETQNSGLVNSLRLFSEDSSYPCILTNDHSLLENASALIFHTVDFAFNYRVVPDKRQPWQRWVYLSLESPMQNGMSDDSYQRGDKVKFNWTMTYRPSADAPYPYWKLFPRKAKPQVDEMKALELRWQEWAKNFAKRPIDGYWMVSHCETQSKREQLFANMEKHGLKMESWGKCSGRIPDDEWRVNDVDQFFLKYRYYLSFENSLCDDYMTEKAFGGIFHNLQHGLIPVVYGEVNYEKALPKGSFIDARKFTPVDLAAFLKNLTNSPEKIIEYYKWQTDYTMEYRRIPDTKYLQRNYGLKYGWYTMCERLWSAPENESKVITNLRETFGSCHDPPPFN